MNNFKERKEKGITLIALVVTIVVLIILATVSINAVFGQNGLISKAEQAKEEQRGAEVQDVVAIWKLDKELSGYIEGEGETKEELLTRLQNEGLLTASEKADIEANGAVTIGSHTISFAKTLVEMFNDEELQIGDYVNYQNPTSGVKTISGEDSGMEGFDQTFDVSKNQLTWRVLGIDEETGGLKLIAGSPMKANHLETAGIPYFYMRGAKGYINAERNLKKICSIYKNDLAVEARSVTVEDINAVTGAVGDVLDSVNISKGYKQPYSFTDKYTPESYLNGKTTTVSGTDDAYAYYADAEGLTTATDTKLFNLLFNNVEYNQGACYWLASRCVTADSHDASFVIRAVFKVETWTLVTCCFNMFYAVGDESVDGYAVRPVVILSPDVTENDIQKTDQTEIEATWNYTLP